MRRGEVWTLRDDRFAAKARPVVVVQSDEVTFNWTVVCLFTTFDSSDVPTRVLIPANERNGLRMDSYVMTEKLAAVEPSEFGVRLGLLTDQQMDQVAKAVAQVLGFSVGA